MKLTFLKGHSEEIADTKSHRKTVQVHYGKGGTYEVEQKLADKLMADKIAVDPTKTSGSTLTTSFQKASSTKKPSASNK